MNFTLLLTTLLLVSANLFSQLAITIPNDFEKGESLMIIWAYEPAIDSVQTEIVSISKNHSDVVIIYDPDNYSFDTTDIRSFLELFNADSSNINFTAAKTNTAWLRQYAPIIGYGVFANTLERYFGDPGFDSYNRPLDDSLLIKSYAHLSTY